MILANVKLEATFFKQISLLLLYHFTMAWDIYKVRISSISAIRSLRDKLVACNKFSYNIPSSSRPIL